MDNSSSRLLQVSCSCLCLRREHTYLFEEFRRIRPNIATSACSRRRDALPRNWCLLGVVSSPYMPPLHTGCFGDHGNRDAAQPHYVLASSVTWDCLLPSEKQRQARELGITGVERHTVQRPSTLSRGRAAQKYSSLRSSLHKVLPKRASRHVDIYVSERACRTTNTKRCCKIARLTGTTGESSCLHEGRPRVNPSRWPHQHRVPPSCLLLLSEQHQHRWHDVERVGGAGASLRSERHRVGDRQRPASRSEPTASFVLSHPTTLARAPLRSSTETTLRRAYAR